MNLTGDSSIDYKNSPLNGVKEDSFSGGVRTGQQEFMLKPPKTPSQLQREKRKATDDLIGL